MHNYSTYVENMEKAMATIKGELYKFTVDKVKKSSRVIRHCLSDIRKYSKEMRVMIQEDLKAIPTPRKKNMTQEQITLMVNRRRATMAAKQAAK